MMSIGFISRMLALLLFSIIPLQSIATERFENILPADSELVLLIENTTKLVERLPEHPLIRAWNHDHVRYELTELGNWTQMDRWDAYAQKTLGYPLADVLAGFSGQLAWTAPTLSALFDEVPSFGILARVNDQLIAPETLIPPIYQALTRFSTPESEDSAKSAPAPQFRDIEDEFYGEILHIRQTIQDREVRDGLGWALVDDVLVLAQPKSYLQTLVAALKQEDQNTAWGHSEILQDFGQSPAEVDALLYLDTSRLSEALDQYFAQQADLENETLFMRNILQELVGNNLRGLFLTSAIDAASTTLDFNLLYEKDQGLIKLLAYQPGPVQWPQLVPAGATTASVSNFSFTALWQALVEMADRSENLAWLNMVRAQLKPFSEQAGFDLEKTLLDSLGSQFIEMTLPAYSDQPGEHSAEQDTLVALSGRDQQALEMVLEAIKTQTGLAGLLEKRDYLDTVLYTVKPSLQQSGSIFGAFPVAYSVSKGYWLLANNTTALQRALAALENPQAQASPWLDADTRSVIDRLPPDASALSVHEPTQMLYDLFQQLISVQNLLPHEENTCRPQSTLEPEPFTELLNAAVGATYKKDRRFRVYYRFWHAGV